ncbi:MAG: DUF1667 domain-containing protein [Erysipelotrichaceae bacterium]|nr:DUF1667 domain-containing protein [Erysipelotrichaceae bacterium]
MTELICIGCPRGCHLMVDEENDYKVSGNHCKIGEDYGKNELINPTRVLTTTVKIKGGLHSQLPCKSDGAIPKSKLLEACRSLKEVCVSSPVKKGDIIVKNILDTGIDIISCKDM